MASLFSPDSPVALVRPAARLAFPARLWGAVAALWRGRGATVGGLRAARLRDLGLDAVATDLGQARADHWRHR